MKNYEEFKTKVEELAKPYNLDDNKIKAFVLHGYRTFSNYDIFDISSESGIDANYVNSVINDLNTDLKVNPYIFKAYFEIMDAAIEEEVEIE